MKKMKKIKQLALALISCLTLTTVTFARGEEETFLACGIIAIVWLVVFAIVVTIDVLIFRWIKRDATARGMPNANSLKWLGLLNWVGAVIYLIVRSKNAPPQGNYPPR